MPLTNESSKYHYSFERYCDCANPIIRCDNRGCRCVMCHLPQRLDLSFDKPKWSKPVVQEVNYSPRIEEHMRGIFAQSKEFVTVHREY